MNNQVVLQERLLKINPWIGQAKGTQQAMNMIKALMPVKYIPRQSSKPRLNPVSVRIDVALDEIQEGLRGEIKAVKQTIQASK